MREKQVEREGAALGHETGWVEVVRRKKQAHGGDGKLDVATNAWKLSIKDTFSFYFSDFPKTHGAREMLRAFKLYGEAMEVVISPKRDKWGKRFGFVRFSNVDDLRVFAIKLDNIIFGANKIHVNVPRFQREWHGRSKLQQIQQPRKVEEREVQHGKQTLQQHREVSRRTYQAQQRRVNQIWRKKEGGRAASAEYAESHLSQEK